MLDNPVPLRLPSFSSLKTTLFYFIFSINFCAISFFSSAWTGFDVTVFQVVDKAIVIGYFQTNYALKNFFVVFTLFSKSHKVFFLCSRTHLASAGRPDELGMEPLT